MQGQNVGQVYTFTPIDTSLHQSTSPNAFGSHTTTGHGAAVGQTRKAKCGLAYPVRIWSFRNARSAMLLPYMLWQCITCYCERISTGQDPPVRPCGRRRHVAVRVSGPCPRVIRGGRQRAAGDAAPPSAPAVPSICHIPHLSPPFPCPRTNLQLVHASCLLDTTALDGASHSVQRNIARNLYTIPCMQILSSYTYLPLLLHSRALAEHQLSGLQRTDMQSAGEPRTAQNHCNTC